MLDIDTNACQTHHITAPVPKVGTDAPCCCSGEIREEFKFGHGGARPGAGRKPKPIVITEPEPIRWYCVRTEYAAELHADVAIRVAGFETFFPLLWVPPVDAHRTADGRAIPAKPPRLLPLMPRYLLVRFARTNPSWRAICNLRGVEKVFSTHPERPTPIPDRDIDALRVGLAPNGVLYPPKRPERDKSAKRRWVDMATALLSMVEAGDSG